MSEPADTVIGLVGPGLARHRGRLVVLIDGGSGSGKTTLGTELTDALHAAGRPVRLVGLDEFYPGWDGLAAASDMVVTDLLHPVTPGYHRWDWTADRTADWVRLDPAEDLVIEGCGALTPASAAYATLSIWLDRPAAIRKKLALARDGAGFAAHWSQWAAQEHRHWLEHRPRTVAGLVISLAPRVR